MTKMIATSTGKVRKREWRYCPTCRVSWGEEDGEHPAPKTEGQPKCSFKGLKRGAYEYSIVVDGERKREQFPTRAEAQTALDDLKEELRRPKAQDAPKVTLGDALDQCLSLKARRACTTVSEYQRIADHLKAAFGADTPLTEITAS